jgi:hypothetical protein
MSPSVSEHDVDGEDELFPPGYFDNDEPFAFMGDEPEVTLTPAEEAVANHAPSVRATMVLQNGRKHGNVTYAVGDIVTVAIPAEYC